jgi:microsomal dipeptidase-like Zn-dependent dipeptidase
VKKAALALGAAAVLSGVFFGAAPIVGRRLNRTLHPPPYRVSERARALHATLRVVDLHADALLWGRDLLALGTWGHVDVPRLVEGNVALQAFTIVTKSPRHLNIEKNDDATDDITALAVAQRWPRATWTSLAARALYQAGRLRETARRSGGRFTLIETSRDLELYLARREKEPRIAAGFLGVEGAHALQGKVANVDAFFDAGIRMMSPTHFFDDELGGSAHGVAKGGLTPFGREVVRRMEEKRMLVDLAHASPPLIADVLAIAKRPVVVSHTGVKGTCDNRRNLSDEELRGVAATGGLVGIGYWETAVCGEDAAAVARAIRHAVAVAGVDHVALGSDFDGAIAAPFDTSGVPLVTEALLTQGLREDAIRKVMGENALRVLAEALPPGR